MGHLKPHIVLAEEIKELLFRVLLDLMASELVMEHHYAFVGLPLPLIDVIAPAVEQSMVGFSHHHLTRDSLNKFSVQFATLLDLRNDNFEH